MGTHRVRLEHRAFSIMSGVVLAATTACAGGTSPTVPAPGSSAAVPIDPAVNTVAANALLPDLVMLPLTEFRLAQDNGRPTLRFSALAKNIGEGPFELTGSRPGTGTTDMDVIQTVHHADGGKETIPTDAVMHFSVFDDHDHFHVQDFEGYWLAPVGVAAAGRGNKEGFCIEEDLRQDGQVPKGYGDCGEDHPELLTVQQGLAVGWVDRYAWNLEGQFVYLDGLTLPGEFCVSATADPRSFFTEETRSNNTTSVSVRISKMSVDVIKKGC
ncbi:lysyl oxidase family protein [Pseudonocardia yunnanensis]|uniref:Lysyl oxidase family protein n=1 Tax=Pseudonocardia yunnanensis TaxID=58107 RepID=A0ABW4F9X7_9PSEU